MKSQPKLTPNLGYCDQLNLPFIRTWLLCFFCCCFRLFLFDKIKKKGSINILLQTLHSIRILFSLNFVFCLIFFLLFHHFFEFLFCLYSWYLHKMGCMFALFIQFKPYTYPCSYIFLREVFFKPICFCQFFFTQWRIHTFVWVLFVCLILSIPFGFRSEQWQIKCIPKPFNFCFIVVWNSIYCLYSLLCIQFVFY